MMTMKNKTIVLGVTGSIAAYHAARLVNPLKEVAEVEVIMTESATKFITPLTFQTLSGKLVYQAMFQTITQGDELKHISLADKADLMLIAPATANILGKVSWGIADDLLSATIMATKAPVLFAPAMNVNMWNNSIVKENVTRLCKAGYKFVGPVKGKLACGYSGMGRLAPVEDIIAQAKLLLKFGKK
jgi:phosphopantothenoylcysteine decarboxylase / phosphopantothenate---cysteine ligase